MRTTWEIQCKGLWGLSLGFPSAEYSLHFISWLKRCVAIHLELLRSFDPLFLPARFLRDKKVLCSWNPRVGQEDAAGDQAGDGQQGFPMPKGQVQVSHPPHRNDHTPSWGSQGSIPPRCAKAGTSAGSVLSVSHSMALRGSEGSPHSMAQWDTQLLHGYSWIWMFALRSSQPAKVLATLARTGINNLNTRISSNFFTQKSQPQTRVWFVVFNPKKLQH